MKLTKSLFVEFVTAPHVAWWHMHDKNVYEKIMEKLYGEMDGLAVGRAAEEQVCRLFTGKNIVNVDKIQRKHPDRYQGFHNVTLEAIAQSPDVIYQPAFLLDNLFAKCDFLVKNAEGRYDIREVKAKNGVRKKTKSAELLDDLQADVSFQDFIVRKVLKEKYSGKIYLVYMNKEYVRHGEIRPEELLVREEVSGELKKEEAIVNIIDSMTKTIKLEREEFTKLYPYDNEDHLTYFGKEAEKGTMRYIPQLRSKKKELMEAGKELIDHFTEDERAILFAASGEETKASHYVSLRQQGEKVVNAAGIKQKMESIHFPIFFYDYETIAWPVPLLEGTSPRQQCVVQYSVHRMDEDGTISHKEAIVGAGAKDNETIVQQLVQDLESGEGTYVVWFKGFENARNDEMAKHYPQHTEIFAKINERTFDLMEVFSEQLYFHRKFHGSSSIKKVLPVLTDISYDGLAVPHGAIAAELLAGIVQGKYETDVCNAHIQNLLEYCKQDTWAMVRIYQKVLEEIK